LFKSYEHKIKYRRILTVMPIDKRDLASCLSLTLAFFLMAIWNLGIDDIPISTWMASDCESFYIDLESPKNVSELYLLLIHKKTHERTMLAVLTAFSNFSELKILRVQG
jgi:hypothetical protein